MFPRPVRIDYVGDDLRLLSELVERFGDYDFRRIDPARLKYEDLQGEWRRIVLLDLDVAGEMGFRALWRLKQENAGIPLVLLADPQSHPLTQLALARRHGAEEVIFQPLKSLDQLVAPLGRAAARLDRWQAAVEEILVREQVAAPDVADQAGDPSSLVGATG